MKFPHYAAKFTKKLLISKPCTSMYPLYISCRSLLLKFLLLLTNFFHCLCSPLLKLLLKNKAKIMAAAIIQAESFTFEIERHARDSFKILEHMQRERMFCDVTLVAKDVQIAAHKNVLASCSPYFYAIFTNPQTVDQQRIELDINPLILHSVVKYIYTSNITVNEQDVTDLLEVSKMLLLNGVQVECSNILKRTLRPDNCFNIKRVAANYGDSNLMKSASSFIDDNFIEAVATEEFLNLTSDEMSELISKDTLKMCSEEKVYECIVKWISHNPKGRRKYLRLLMGYVKLRLIPKDYLNRHIIQDPFLKGNCKDLLLKAVVEEYITTDPKPKPRLYDIKVLLVVGGRRDNACNSLEYYDFRKNCWSNALQIPFSICSAKLAVVNQKIYLVGGYRKDRPTCSVNCVRRSACTVNCVRTSACTVNCYDINTNRWDEIANMTSRREAHGVDVLNNCIYAIGGFNGCEALNSTEKFDFQLQKWSLIAPMLNKRYCLGVGTLNDIIYVVGGVNENKTVLNSVECYDQRTDTWQDLNSMNVCRSSAGVCALEGKLYAIGGYDGKDYLSSVEIYNPDTNIWTLIRPMRTARVSHGVAVTDNKIYVTGGRNHNGCLNSIEVYDKTADTWTILPDVMNVARRSHASIFVNKRV